MRIIITGASDGIGKSLALKLSEKGSFLFLTGRNMEKLQKVKEEGERKGANIEIHKIDVKDRYLMDKSIQKFGENGLDLVIANAGICLSEKELNDTKELMDTNFYGMLNTILPSIEIMKVSKKGTVIALSSIVSYQGMEGISGYIASKGAIRLYLEGMSKEWNKYNIKTKIILNGFVKTNMNKSHLDYEKMMSSDSAANIIIKSINNNKLHIHFPLKYKIQFFFRMIKEYFN